MPPLSPPPRNGIALFALLLAVGVLIFPGFFTLPPVDRDEARFAQASAQMIASGDLIDLRIQDRPRYEKPVGIYWLQTAVVSLLDAPDKIWAYRVVSALSALAAVAMTVIIARLMLPLRTALLAGALLGASFILGAEARLAKTDAALLAFTLVPIWVLARLHLVGTVSRAQVALFWAMLAAATLIKGPLAPLLVSFIALGILAQRRNMHALSDLRPIWGLGLYALIVVPWFIAITKVSGGMFWERSLGQDMAGKIAQGMESHGAPPGSYLAAFWLTFWPGSALAIAALAKTLGQSSKDSKSLWQQIKAFAKSPAGGFLLAWVLPYWLIFEAVATKLLHYTLPTYPAVAILIAIGLNSAQVHPLRGPGRILAVLVAFGVPLIVAAGLYFGAADLGLNLGKSWVIGLALALMGAGAMMWRVVRNQPTPLTSAALLLAGLGMALMVFPTLAAQSSLWPANAVAQAWQDLRAKGGPCNQALLITTGYSETSLVFLTIGAVEFATPDRAATAIMSQECALIAVEARSHAELTAMLPLNAPKSSGNITGTNLGSGKKINLTLYTIAP